jgi:hypothetical protein
MLGKLWAWLNRPDTVTAEDRRLVGPWRWWFDVPAPVRRVLLLVTLVAVVVLVVISIWWPDVLRGFEKD